MQSDKPELNYGQSAAPGWTWGRAVGLAMIVLFLLFLAALLALPAILSLLAR